MPARDTPHAKRKPAYVSTLASNNSRKSASCVLESTAAGLRVWWKGKHGRGAADASELADARSRRGGRGGLGAVRAALCAFDLWFRAQTRLTGRRRRRS